MLRFRIKEMIANKEFEGGCRWTIGDIAKETNINRMTLSKMINHRGCTVGSDKLDKLCEFFGCKIGDLVEYIPDEKVSALE